MRPSDWFLVDLNADPTPGDAFGIRSLATTYQQIADIAGDAATGVRNARSSGAASAWVGDAADVFRDRSGRMPGELAKANDSYERVAEALRSWAAAVDDTQAQADRGLQQARDAHADLLAGQAALSSARSTWTTAQAQQLSYQKLEKQYQDAPPPAGVTMPTDYQQRSADRNAQQAQVSIAAAQQAISNAEARLAAAKALVAEAKERRDDAERAAVHAIGVAGDHAVQPSSIWEAIQDSAAWQTVVQIATVVLTIVTIVAIFVGGPVVWAIIAAATILLMVNALMSIAQGKNAWGELIMLGIGLIPGGRLLGLAAKGVDLLARAGSVGTRLAGGIRTVVDVVNGFGGAVTRVIRSFGDRVTGVISDVASRATSALQLLTVKASLAAHLSFGSLRAGEESISSATSIHNLWAFGSPHAGPLNPPTQGALGHYFSDLNAPQSIGDIQQYTATHFQSGVFDYPPQHGFLGGQSTPTVFSPGAGSPNILVRVGSESGGYLAPYGTTFQQSALPFNELNPYEPDFAVKFYEIQQDFTAELGHIAPVDYTTPGGIQLHLNPTLPGAANGMWKVEQLVGAGILRRMDLSEPALTEIPVLSPLILRIPGL